MSKYVGPFDEPENNWDWYGNDISPTEGMTDHWRQQAENRDEYNRNMEVPSFE